MHFPEGFGGLGLAPNFQRHVDDGCARAGAPPAGSRHFFGLTLAGPTIVTHGERRALQDRLLRPMFTGEDVWCQLFSEPGARLRPRRPVDAGPCATATSGSSTGRRSGTRSPTSPTAGMLVARTDPDAPKHKGLTYFVLDMHAPGVEVRPLRQITGEAEFNEVYLTEVRVPDADRIGDVGDGWRVSMTTLMNERTTIGGGGGAAAAGQRGHRRGRAHLAGGGRRPSSRAPGTG